MIEIHYATATIFFAAYVMLLAMSLLLARDARRLRREVDRLNNASLFSIYSGGVPISPSLSFSPASMTKNECERCGAIHKDAQDALLVHTQRMRDFHLGGPLYYERYLDEAALVETLSLVVDKE